MRRVRDTAGGFRMDDPYLAMAHDADSFRFWRLHISSPALANFTSGGTPGGYAAGGAMAAWYLYRNWWITDPVRWWAVYRHWRY